jgi:hypothetical protein
MKLFELFNEEVSQQELRKIGDIADMLWDKLGIEVAFTYHFLDRINERGVTAKELARMFIEQYKQNGGEIAKLKSNNQDPEAVMVDLFTSVNMPFVLKNKGKDRKKALVGITAMKSKNFKTTNKKFFID